MRVPFRMLNYLWIEKIHTHCILSMFQCLEMYVFSDVTSWCQEIYEQAIRINKWTSQRLSHPAHFASSAFITLQKRTKTVLNRFETKCKLFKYCKYHNIISIRSLWEHALSIHNKNFENWSIFMSFHFYTKCFLIVIN